MPTVDLPDDAYIAHLDEVPKALGQSFASCLQLGPVPLDGTFVTRSVLRRLKAYYDSQAATKKFLGKIYRGAAADFFVETIVFFLKVLNESHSLGLRIASEERLVPRRGSIRPDILLRTNADAIAMIECKTQLGWRRGTWKQEFEQREVQLRQHFPRAEAFLVVATAVNWPGFGAVPEAGKKFFTLTHDWPSDVKLENLDKSIKHPIEPLFRRIVALSELNGQRPA